MGRCIIKLTEGERAWYLEWSTVVDAPVTYGMSLDELRAHVKDRYGSEGIAELPGRLARVEKFGTSMMRDESVVDTAWLNRAGKGESRLTYRQMVAMYCGGEDAPEVEGHHCDYEGACGEDGCWTPEKFDDR
jgi:hypothetical protein